MTATVTPTVIGALGTIPNRLLNKLENLEIWKVETMKETWVNLPNLVEGDPKAPFSIATTALCRGGRYSFLWIAPFTLDPYLKMLSVQQGGIKYRFLSLSYDTTRDWIPVSRAIGEHSIRPMARLDHQNYIITIISQNYEKIPGALRRLALSLSLKF